MRNKKDVFLGLLTLMLTFNSVSAMAQRNFYHRIDVGSSNIYSFVGSNLITGYANYLTHDILFDNSFTYSFYNGTYNGKDIKTKSYSMTGLTARELFGDCFAGIKLGYQSDYMSSVNWGLYASCHYKLNQFEAKWPDAQDYSGERAQYLKPGAGLFFTFGSVESQTKVQLEAALRYDMPMGYKGILGTKKDELKSGLSSHFAIKFAGYSWISAGLYMDICHYDLYKDFKDAGKDSKFKMYNVGVTFTITPKRGEDIYD